jgi:hypothetical protein
VVARFKNSKNNTELNSVALETDTQKRANKANFEEWIIERFNTLSNNVFNLR